MDSSFQKSAVEDDVIHNGTDEIIGEDVTTINNRNNVTIVGNDAINNGNEVIIEQERNMIVAAESKKEGKIKASGRKHKNTGISIIYEDLKQLFGMKLDHAADKLDSKLTDFEINFFHSIFFLFSKPANKHSLTSEETGFFFVSSNRREIIFFIIL